MELCLITPTKYVKWMRLLPGRFCLANITTPGYQEAFIAAAKDGYDVVLDNGAFENALVDVNKYIEVARKIQPGVLVAPDLLNFNAEVNWTFARGCAERFKMSGLNSELMFVLQCKRNAKQRYKKVLEEAIKSKLFKWIGICRNFCFNAFVQYTHTLNENMNKFYFGVWAEQNGILELARSEGVRFHLLGIGGDIFMLQYLWWVDRADTASLFYQATLGRTVSPSGVLSEVISRPPDYFRRVFGAEHTWDEKLIHNCKEAQKYATAAKRLRYEILKERI